MTFEPSSTSLMPTHVVGIGASAGGLNALETFFDQLPGNTNMAFVVIQHLSPHFRSLMDDLLARHTAMPIHIATHGVEMEANNIYLIPPNTQMAMRGNRLYLSERKPSPVLDLPIDVFFNSLAEAAKSQALAIILSGTGTDGSRGIKTVHREGGLVLIQTPETAQFDGMPRSALATGSFDHMCSPAEMAEIISEYARSPVEVRERLSKRLSPDLSATEYGEIFSQLQRAFDLDFSRYKVPTVARRIRRRMEILQLETVDAYTAFLAANAEELPALYHDLLIGVTEFFRDPEYFERLGEDLLPELLRGVAPGEDMRIWSAGCATGEEAYSLAILAMEAAESVEFRGRISVFATDVHRTSLEIASAGSYSIDRLKNVSPERLARHFRRDGERYRVNADLRKLVVFAPHNLAKDAPFTKLDLVCCRNLLIYLQPDLQDRIVALFHFALRKNGILFMGSSEAPGVHACAFDPVDSGRKMYRKSCERLPQVSLPVSRFVREPRAILPMLPATNRSAIIDRSLLHDYDTILARLTPGIIIDENRQLLHYCGDVARFMAMPKGRPGKDLFDLIDGDLQVALHTALPRAEKSGERVDILNLRVKRDQEELFTNLTVDPIWNSKTRTNHFHIYFSEMRPTNPLQSAPFTEFESDSHLRQLVADLKNELRSSKENLQTAIEELQTSNEQLQATNEELLASNEELQSTNEELHSVNEELYTVNSEFERKNNELAKLNLDHEHLLASIQVGIIFLDQNCRIRKFNEFIGASFRLLPQDIGRPIDNIAYHLEDARHVVEDVQQVLSTGVTVEKEVVAPDGTVLFKRVLAYRDDRGEVNGVVLTFTDVTSLKAAERKVSRMNAELERLVDERTAQLMEEVAARERTEIALNESIEKYRVLFTTLQPLAFVLTDQEGRVREANPYASELLKIHENELLQRRIDSEQWGMSTENGPLAPVEYPPVKALRERRTITNQEVCVPDPTGQPMWLNVSAAPLGLDNYGVVMTALDISERRAALDALKASEKRFRTLFESMQEGFALHELVCDEDGTPVDYRFLEVNSAFARLIGKPAQKIVGKTMGQLFPGYAPLWLERFRQVAETGQPVQFEEQVDQLDCYLEVAVFSPAEGHFAAVYLDATARRRFQEEQLKRQKLESLGVLAGGIAHDFNNIFTAVIGNLSLAAAQEELPAEIGKLLTETLEGCERASGLSQQLLTFARGGDLRKTIFAPQSLLEQSVNIVGCGGSTVWEWNVSPGGHLIEADAGQMTQVFNNILLNAVQAMPRGGKVRIGLEGVKLGAANELSLRPGEYVKVTFADDGSGIAPENLDKIFDPFFTTKVSGTGLGLASVHSIVRRHEGHIAVHSTPGKGTTFTIYLPATSKGIPAEKAAKPSVDKVIAGARVLVMDDEAPIRSLLARIIHRVGCVVETVSTGTEAIDRYRTALVKGARYDAVILDLTVPGGMGGEAAAKEILKLDPNARLIVSSGYSTDPVMSRYREHGFCAGIAKPYRYHELNRILTGVLSGNLARAQELGK